MTDLKRVIEWMGSRDTGLSSQAIAMHMTLGDCDGSYPHDPSDLGRCLRLLEAFPEWKSRIAEMARYGTGWIAMAERWQEMADSMAEEVGIDWSQGRSAPVTYELMHAIANEGWGRDPKWECEFSDGRLRSARRKETA